MPYEAHAIAEWQEAGPTFGSAIWQRNLAELPQLDVDCIVKGGHAMQEALEFIYWNLLEAALDYITPFMRMASPRRGASHSRAAMWSVDDDAAAARMTHWSGVSAARRHRRAGLRLQQSQRWVQQPSGGMSQAGRPFTSAARTNRGL